MATAVQPAEKVDPNKKQIESARKYISLIGGVPPQLIVQPTQKRTQSEPPGKSVAPAWQYVPFESESRNDHLKLFHWQKEGSPNLYSKLGKKLEIAKYTDKEYDELIADLNPSWTRRETDKLMKLCERYELRFVVIADRFMKYKEYKRSTEELKDRYFSIAKCLLEARGDVANQLVKKPYNMDYEVKRKANLEKIFQRTVDHQNTEKTFLEEAKKIDQRIKREEKEQKNLNKLMSKEGIADNLGQNDQDTFSTYRRQPFITKSSGLMKAAPFAVVNTGSDSPMHSPSGRGGRRDRGSGVYLRSQLMNAPLPIPEKAQKKLDTILEELGVPKKLVPTEAVLRVYDNLRKEILALLSLEKHVQKKEKEQQNLKKKEAELEKAIKQMQSQPPNPGVMPNQGRGPIMMPGNMPPGMQPPTGMQPPGAHMMATPGGQHPSQSHMQQMPPGQQMPIMHQGYAMQMPGQGNQPSMGQYAYMRQHAIMSRGQPPEGDKTNDGSMAGMHQHRHSSAVPQGMPQNIPVPQNDLTNSQTPVTQIKVERVPQTPQPASPEDMVKQEEKPETPATAQKKSRRKGKGERAKKRAAPEENDTPDSSTDKKKKKY